MIALSPIDTLVLSTVNAPYRRAIDAESLALCLRDGDVDDWAVHVATLFTDVRPGLVVDFANAHGVNVAGLSRTYLKIRTATGERNPAFEAVLVDLAGAPGPDDRRPGAAL